MTIIVILNETNIHRYAQHDISYIQMNITTICWRSHFPCNLIASQQASSASFMCHITIAVVVAGDD